MDFYSNRCVCVLLLYIIVSFIQGSHTHIPETNHVPRGYIVAATLSLLFMVPLCLVPALVLLFFYVSTFRSMCAVPNMAVFCSSLTLLLLLLLLLLQTYIFMFQCFMRLLYILMLYLCVVLTKHAFYVDNGF